MQNTDQIAGHASHGLAGHRHNADPGVRKQELLREGEFYRASIARSQAHLREAIRPEVMLRSTFDRAALVLRSGGNIFVKPGGKPKLTVLMPYAMGALRLVRSRKLSKRALGIGLAMAAAAWFMVRRRKSPSPEVEVLPAPE